MSEHYFEVDGIAYYRPQVGENNYYQTAKMFELKEVHYDDICECEDGTGFVAWDEPYQCRFDGRSEEDLIEDCL